MNGVLSQYTLDKVASVTDLERSLILEQGQLSLSGPVIIVISINGESKIYCFRPSNDWDRLGGFIFRSKPGQDRIEAEKLEENGDDECCLCFDLYTLLCAEFGSEAIAARANRRFRKSNDLIGHPGEDSLKEFQDPEMDLKWIYAKMALDIMKELRPKLFAST